MTTFKVLQNLKHSGETYEVGRVFEGEMSEFGHLVDSGTIKVFTGEEDEEVKAEDSTPAPENTWGPKKDDEVKVYDGPMVKVKFIKKYKVVDENGAKTGEVIKAGDELELPEPAVEKLVNDGIVEVVVEEDNTEMGTYKITGVADYTDEKGVKMGELEIDSIQSLPVVIGDTFVEQGVAEKVEDENKNKE